MLKLTPPIKTRCLGQPAETGRRFYETITGNYRFFPNHISPQELLHMTTLPTEILLAGEIGPVNVFSDNEVRSQIRIDMICQMFNRLQLYGTGNFTYQDSVFVTNLLRQAGVRHPDIFFRQLRTYREEVSQVYGLIMRYRELGGSVGRMVRELGGDLAAVSEKADTSGAVRPEKVKPSGAAYPEDGKASGTAYTEKESTKENVYTVKLPEVGRTGEAGSPGVAENENRKIPERYFLHDSIYERVGTAEAVRVLAAYTGMGEAVNGSRFIREQTELAMFFRSAGALYLERRRKEVFGTGSRMIYSVADYPRWFPEETGRTPAEQAEENLAAGTLLRLAQETGIMTGSAYRLRWRDYSGILYRGAEPVLERFRNGGRSAEEEIWHGARYDRQDRDQTLVEETELLRYFENVSRREGPGRTDLMKETVLALLQLGNVQRQMTELFYLSAAEYISSGGQESETAGYRDTEPYPRYPGKEAQRIGSAGEMLFQESVLPERGQIASDSLSVTEDLRRETSGVLPGTKNPGQEIPGALPGTKNPGREIPGALPGTKNPGREIPGVLTGTENMQPETAAGRAGDNGFLPETSPLRYAMPAEPFRETGRPGLAEQAGPADLWEAAGPPDGAGPAEENGGKAGEMRAWRRFLDQVNERNVRIREQVESSREREETRIRTLLPNRREIRKQALYFLEHPEELPGSVENRGAGPLPGHGAAETAPEDRERNPHGSRRGMGNRAEPAAAAEPESQQAMRLSLHTALEEAGREREAAPAGEESGEEFLSYAREKARTQLWEERKTGGRRNRHIRSAEMLHREQESVWEEKLLQRLGQMKRSLLSETVSSVKEQLRASESKSAVIREEIRKERGEDRVQSFPDESPHSRIGRITDQVYQRLEKRLQSERKRRGF